MIDQVHWTYGNIDKKHEIIIHEPLGQSDHAVISFEYCIDYLHKSHGSRKQYNYNKGNYKLMKEFLRLDWKELPDDQNLCDAWEIFKHK